MSAGSVRCSVATALRASVGLIDAGHLLLEKDLDLQFTYPFRNDGAHVLVECCHGLARRVDEGHLHAARLQRLRHLDPYVSTADNDRPRGFLVVHPPSNRDSVLQHLNPKDPV